MNKPEIIDFSVLERELHRAVEADKKYQRENDAKFRAIHQKVSSYEEFRDIVRASHLKPLEKKDVHGSPRKQPWNSLASANKERQPASSETEQSALEESEPRSASEFSRDWRRFRGGSVEKYSFLTGLGGPKLRQIFSIEVGFGLLGEFLTVLSQGLRSGDEEAVSGLLEGLSQTGRFGLNLSLLSAEERAACQRLFQKLQETKRDKRPEEGDAERAERIERLMTKYEV